MQTTAISTDGLNEETLAWLNKEHMEGVTNKEMLSILQEGDEGVDPSRWWQFTGWTTVDGVMAARIGWEYMVGAESQGEDGTCPSENDGELIYKISSKSLQEDLLGDWGIFGQIQDRANAFREFKQLGLATATPHTGSKKSISI